MEHYIKYCCSRFLSNVLGQGAGAFEISSQKAILKLSSWPPYSRGRISTVEYGDWKRCVDTLATQIAPGGMGIPVELRRL